MLQTKAEYICADQPVTLIFRLRQSGGPYIPVWPSSAQPETLRSCRERYQTSISSADRQRSSRFLLL